MGSFKVGDKVRCVKRPVDNTRYKSLVGKTGTVDIVDSDTSVVVKWDDWNDGWGTNDDKWRVANDEVELVRNTGFKPGDKVIIIKERGNERYGETAIVISDEGAAGGIFPVRVCRQDGQTEPFSRRNLELVASDAGLFIVIVEQDGRLAPATTPKTYGTAALAQHVADDMAKRHGGKFYVFRATYESVNTVSSRSL